MTDLHLHTLFSHDSEEQAENYVIAAINAGAASLGFSEHYDYDVYLGGGDECPLPDLSAYSEKISALKAEYPAIKILKGVELGFSPDAVPRYNKLLKEGNFDYSILSVHTVKGRGDCFFPKFFEGLSLRDAYGAYFKAVLESVRSDINYNIVGHIGYVERYAPYADKRIAYGEFADILDEILKVIISRDKCLEINTSAKGTDGITLPNTEIIDRYIALGGKNFSLGSDAHSAKRYAENFSAVRSLLLSRGITYTCRFEAGKNIKEKI